MRNFPIFTPRHLTTGVRVEWHNIAVPDVPRHGPGSRAWYPMKDPTGQPIEVRSASCGAGCRCDMVYREVTP